MTTMYWHIARYFIVMAVFMLRLYTLGKPSIADRIRDHFAKR